ncbi:unnamed protein product [Cuscuta europaea]|uniref:UV-B-induced protein At3g17800, chloroplastic-like n=1 Tax=Cuscuta europaea TaxID=41803 RepID=A0A9P0YSP1_CUSEU|nr:unnamed protein product [Cuscuta europaea]
MDCTLFSRTTSSSALNCSTFTAKNAKPPFRLAFQNWLARGSVPGLRKRLVLVASGRNSSNQCEFSGLTAPLEPTTPPGRLLSTVFQNDREYFPIAVEKQLMQLGYDRDEAVARMNLSLGSDEACLHRRIADLREMDCQTGVEDVMYMLILYKFSEIKVHLVPRLSKCIYKGRLEIWPSRDWQLESIHSSEVLDMVKDHLVTVIGWRPDSSVTENWAPTKVGRIHLSKVYAESILYGYFLKSVSLRHHLEQTLLEGYSLSSKRPLCPSGQGSGLQMSLVHEVKPETTLKSYVMRRFDRETVQMYGKPKSKAAINLMERHTNALFGVVDRDDEISTSLASLKRIVLEAVAFGSFLWETEEYTNTKYNHEAY